jgi:hypothetical protein
MPNDDTLGQLSRAQSGLLSRQQLKDAGLSPAAIRWRTGRAWTLALPGVVATSRERLTPHQRLIAACLEAGPEGIVSGSYACAWHGLTSVRLEGPVLVLVPDHLASRRVGFVQIRRTRCPDHHPFERPPARIASRSRAVIDACKSTDNPRDARALVIEAVQRHLVRLEDLDHELNAGGLRNSRAARTALADARAGAWSVPEADLLTLCRTSTILPRTWPNPRIRTPDGLELVSPDLWLDDIGMAVMAWPSWSTPGLTTFASSSGSRRSSTTASSRSTA